MWRSTPMRTRIRARCGVALARSLTSFLFLAAFLRPATLHSQPIAVLDADADGVPDAFDACPGLGKRGLVNSLGCPDEDLDGVPDTLDRCAGTPFGAAIGSDGCPLTLDGITLPEIVPFDVRRQWLVDLVRTVPHRINCPDDLIPPAPPQVVFPDLSSVVFKGFPRGMAIAWRKVADDCPPVTYVLDIEINLSNACKFLDRRILGCRQGPGWTPWLRRTGMVPPLHFFTWPADNWARYRVYAVDGNGHSSPAQPWRYFRFYSGTGPPPPADPPPP